MEEKKLPKLTGDEKVVIEFTCDQLSSLVDNLADIKFHRTLEQKAEEIDDAFTALEEHYTNDMMLYMGAVLSTLLNDFWAASGDKTLSRFINRFKKNLIDIQLKDAEALVTKYKIFEEKKDEKIS